MRMANYEQKINYNQSKYSFNILAQTYDCNYHPIFKKLSMIYSSCVRMQL